MASDTDPIVELMHTFGVMPDRTSQAVHALADVVVKLETRVSELEQRVREDDEALDRTIPGRLGP